MIILSLFFNVVPVIERITFLYNFKFQDSNFTGCSRCIWKDFENVKYCYTRNTVRIVAERLRLPAALPPLDPELTRFWHLDADLIGQEELGTQRALILLCVFDFCTLLQ